MVQGFFNDFFSRNVECEIVAFGTMIHKIRLEITYILISFSFHRSVESGNRMSLGYKIITLKDKSKEYKLATCQL